MAGDLNTLLGLNSPLQFAQQPQAVDPQMQAIMEAIQGMQAPQLPVPEETSTRQRVLTAIGAALLGGGGSPGVGFQAIRDLQARGDQRQQVQRQNELLRARTDQQKQGLRLDELIRQQGITRQDEKEAEALARQQAEAERLAQAEFDSTVDTLTQQAGVLEVPIDDLDLNSRDGRNEAAIRIGREQLRREQSQVDEATQKEMQGAMLETEITAGEVLKAEVERIQGDANFTGGSREMKKAARRRAQQMFKISLIQAEAILRGSGHSEQAIRQWVAAQQGRFESILQQEQAEAVTIPEGPRPAKVTVRPTGSGTVKLPAGRR